MRFILLSAALALVATQAAFADETRIFAGGGYESIDVKHAGESMNHAGLNLGARVQWAFTDLAALEFLLGGGLDYSRLSGEKGSGAGKVEATISEPQLALEAGIGGNVMPGLLNLQGTVGYNFGFMGTDTVKDGGEEKKADLDKFARLTLNGRAFYTLNEAVSLGLGVSYLSGQLRAKGGKESDLRGWSTGLFVQTKL